MHSSDRAQARFTVASLRGIVPSLDSLGPMELVDTGQSTASVFRVHRPGGAVEYLKVADVDSPDPIRNEYNSLIFLASVGIPVALIIEFGCVDRVEFLRTEAVPGFHADAPDVPYDGDVIVTVFAAMLRRLHAAPMQGCPVRRRTGDLVAIAQHRFLAGLVDVEDFDDARVDVDPVKLIEYLKGAIPDEDLAVTHGDASGSNLLIVEPGLSGVFIDVARSGVADRWSDLAIAERSIRNRWGDAAVSDFFDRYGIREDPARVEYFQTLDEFF